MSWFPLHSWRIFSLGIEFWISTSFLFQHLKNVMQIPSWSLWFLMRSLLSFELSFPSVSLLFLSSFCCLCFSEIWLWCILVCISLGLSCLELTQLLESQLMSGEGCSHYFSMYVFSPTYSLLPRSNNKSIRSFAIVSQFPEALFFPFSSQSIFSLFFRLGNLYCSVFKLTDSFLYLLHSAIDSIQWVFNFWLLYFSVLNFHFVFFLYLLFLFFFFYVSKDISLNFYWRQSYIQIMFPRNDSWIKKDKWLLGHYFRLEGWKVEGCHLELKYTGKITGILQWQRIYTFFCKLKRKAQ